MLRVLQSVNIMDRAGLETMLMNYYRHMDKSVIQFDFLTHRPAAGAYDDEIRAMGGMVYQAPRLYIQHLPLYYKFMNRFFNEHKEYTIIHSHIDAMSYFPLSAAKKNDIPVRIAHSHSSRLDKDFKLPIKYLALKAIPRVANINCACGEVASHFMFNNSEYKLIRNAIELEKFSFNEDVRSHVRSKLGIENKFVLGHVGRYCYIKNQLFLLDVFYEVVKIIPESVLLLIGKGSDEEQIREKAKHLEIESRVKLLVDRSDVNELYQAMDVFVMPSLFEGLPVVGVEAQANGLQCIVSNRISSEIMLTDNIEMMPLAKSATEWAKKIVNVKAQRNSMAVSQLKERGYDIVTEAKKLQEWYLTLYRQAVTESEII